MTFQNNNTDRLLLPLDDDDVPVPPPTFCTFHFSQQMMRSLRSRFDTVCEC